VLAWALWCKRRRIVVLAALTLLLNALLIGRLSWHPEVSRAAVAPDFALRVVSLNVLTSNQDTQAVLDYLTRADADVIFLMEVDQRWIAALQPLHAQYPHRILQPRADNFGVAMLSRIPWSRGDVVDVGPAGVPSVEIGMTHHGRDFVLIGTHTIPPVGPGHAAVRDHHLAALAQRVQQLRAPVLVVGDLNATPWSVGVRVAMGGNLGFRSLAAPWTPTWRARSVFAVPIDHALCSAPLVIVQRTVGPDVGSDHRPLQITAGWTQ
jgi:endonuclease/exonuclease/phosphatase (EEP) superfamily protein YafD